ncbi:dicarboxylate/amino acid:cation symporter [Mesobacillus maritimus]|uniref:dicarboxylate/amino acid:cation symporter n=1 Tax=Mesobacillus maritimus TaxID=1643336 RepID=UPI00203E7897|nr:dicarboxylate/amino acid:cation symporter [Mesobacillus maritimus]MCM3584383.1 dicarboxylate/amino acid:cation symporter [Mesobacillus maritimus]MCM3669200.1 dicarboxylate/amino acid:cation symporter [Mesobacillus maritimus]
MKKIGMLGQIFIGFVLAIIFGVIFGPKMEVVQPLGDFFLRLIKFIVVPLVLASLITGITSLDNVKKLMTVGGKTLAYFMVTTFMAVTIGLLIGTIIAPGKGLNIAVPTENTEQQEIPSFLETFLNIIPTNPFESLSTGNILQIIFIAIAVGIAITAVGEKAKPLANVFDALAEVMYKITGVIMKLAPIGIFGIMAPIVGNYGLSIILPLLKVILAVAIACAIQLFVTYSIAVKTLGKMSPIKFVKGIAPAGLVAFTTASSSATLPVSIKNTEENLGVSKEISSFVLPLGSTINMDGAAIYQGIAVIFIAQFFNIELSVIQIFTVMLMAVLVSIGAAGVPGAGLIMLTLVLQSVNLPLEGIALVAAIDRILDMFRTSLNVIGDASAAVVVQQSENKKKQAKVA